MDSQSYAQGSFYEIFICRAHKKERHQVKGADGSAMKNLIDTENGINLSRSAGAYEKQLASVKSHMEKALDKYLKFKLTLEERDRVEMLKERLSRASDSYALMNIVNAGLEATQRFKEY